MSDWMLLLVFWSVMWTIGLKLGHVARYIVDERKRR